MSELRVIHRGNHLLLRARRRRTGRDESQVLHWLRLLCERLARESMDYMLCARDKGAPHLYLLLGQWRPRVQRGFPH